MTVHEQKSKYMYRSRKLLPSMQSVNKGNYQNITKTRLYSFDPFKPHFYTVKLGITGVYIIFLFSAQKTQIVGTR